ncbi:RNA-directed DNA polymerase [bacterium]|nr:RNA-directed DNA polymerase [bacterium]
MSFLNWLTSLFKPKPPARNISGLAGTDAIEVEEHVDLSGGPLKPKQLRLATQDKRLLPKAKKAIDPRNWVPRKKPKIMPREEADRRFSESLRTSNRKISTLASDVEQLERYGLPIWNSEADIAAALEMSTSQLRHFSIHRQRETSPHYVTFAIRKRTGGHRLIHAPKTRLKRIQRQLNELLVSRLPVSDAAHGFRAQRSVATNAEPHVGKQVVIKLDLADCFPTIHYGRVRGMLISLGYSYEVAAVLSLLCTEAERQPVAADGKTYFVPIGPRVCVQGAPTSPGLCNAVLLRMDRRLAGLAKKFDFQYTRYADDLTLSGDDASKAKVLIRLAKEIVQDEGFRLNSKKTRVVRHGQRQRVAGVVVNDQKGLSRTERRKLRAAIHQLDPADEKSARHLRGKVAYLAMLSEQQAAPLRAALAVKLSGDA